MSRTIRLFYRGMKGRVRANFNWGIDPPITKKSVVLMSAAQATVYPGIIGPEDLTAVHLGDADISVTNVSPHEGGVEFILHVNFKDPLDVLVDLTVMDPYEEFFAV